MRPGYILSDDAGKPDGQRNKSSQAGDRIVLLPEWGNMADPLSASEVDELERLNNEHRSLSVHEGQRLFATVRDRERQRDQERHVRETAERESLHHAKRTAQLYLERDELQRQLIDRGQQFAEAWEQARYAGRVVGISAKFLPALICGVGDKATEIIEQRDELNKKRNEIQGYLNAIAGVLHPGKQEPFTYLPQQLAGMVSELQRQLEAAQNAMGNARVHLVCEQLPGAHRTGMPLEIIDAELRRTAGEPPPPNIPHASDCASWVGEPCDCVTGKPDAV